MRALMFAALLIPAAPGLAQPLMQTHEEVRMPAGKTVKLYRPLTRDDCRAAVRHHQAGKGALHAPAVQSERCATLAANAAKPAAAVATGN